MTSTCSSNAGGPARRHSARAARSLATSTASRREEATADVALHRGHVLRVALAGGRSAYASRAATAAVDGVFRSRRGYGRARNDLARMMRVIPLFTRRILRGERDHGLGGNDKVLDFTDVDDCVDGIVRGIDALATARVRNETVNLATAQGNTLVRVAELIGEAVGNGARS